MIKKIYHFIAFSLLKLVSLLPFKVLYILAAVISSFLNRIYNYRKKIILENFKNAFPEWSDQKQKMALKQFYKYFAIMLMESVKMFSMNLNTLEKHISFKNPEVLQDYFKKGKSVIVISAHYGNWEWLLGLRNEIPHHGMAIYKPLNDEYFNKLMTNARSSFNTSLVSMREIPKVLMKLKSEGIPSLSVYIADQSPVWQEIQYWTNFMNQMTPVYLGPEKLARKLDMAVVYFRMRVLSRGKYEVEIIPITDEAAKTAEYDITDRHVKLLEEDIKLHPEYWLWSHRRWKLTKKRMEEESQNNFRFEGQYKRKSTHA